MSISRGRDQKVQPKAASKYGTSQTEAEHKRTLSWGNISPFRLKLLIASITASGDAITLGSTRQGGLMFTVLEQDERYREYSSDIDDLEEKMRRYTDAALAAVPQQVRDAIIEQCREI